MTSHILMWGAPELRGPACDTGTQKSELPAWKGDRELREEEERSNQHRTCRLGEKTPLQLRQSSWLHASREMRKKRTFNKSVVWIYATSFLMHQFLQICPSRQPLCRHWAEYKGFASPPPLLHRPVTLKLRLLVKYNIRNTCICLIAFAGFEKCRIWARQIAAATLNTREQIARRERNGRLQQRLRPVAVWERDEHLYIIHLQKHIHYSWSHIPVPSAVARRPPKYLRVSYQRSGGSQSCHVWV